jgi:hypothetical protein
VSRWTTRAVQAAGHRPELLYAAMTPEWLAMAAEIVPLDEVMMVPGAEPEATDPADLAVAFLAEGDLLDRKVRALCHQASQVGPLVDLVGLETFARFVADETFRAPTPEDWPALLGPIIDGRADAVFGSRFLGGPHRVLFFWHSVGNKMLTMFSNMMTNLNLTDMETCYKAMRGDLARRLQPDLRSDRFGFEPEITARLARAQARIFEVPISYSGRTYAEGKKINWKDGIAAFWHILKFNLLA